MLILQQYNEKIVKYDLLNKFKYNNVKNIPKLKYILLNFTFKNREIKNLIPILGALKLITFQNSKITKSKISNIVFKIRKGNPVGCKVTLRKNKMNKILFSLISETLPTFKYNKLNNSNIFLFKINNSLIFNELENNYQFFKKLPSLLIYIKFSECSFKEFICLIQSYKLINNKITQM